MSSLLLLKARAFSPQIFQELLDVWLRQVGRCSSDSLQPGQGFLGHGLESYTTLF
jgi:hypothetical protein